MSSGRLLLVGFGLVLFAAPAPAAERLRVTAAKATLYSRPTVDSFALLRLEKGAELELLERAGDWHLAKVLTSTVKGAVGVKGYIARADVEAVAAREEAPAPPPPTPPPTPRPAAPRSVPPPTRPPEPTPVSPPTVVPEAPRPVAPQPSPPPRAPVPAASVVPPSPSRPRLVVLANGGAAPMTLDFDQTRTFTDFAESGSLSVKYAYDRGYGGELGLRYFVWQGLGIEAVGSFLRRSGSADYTGSFPHPLYLNRPRSATGTVDGLSHKEAVGYLNLVYGGERGAVAYAVAGGVAYFFKVEPNLLGVPHYSHVYPYDTITVTEVPVATPSDKAVGFDVGGEVEYRFSERVGAALSVRYSRATIDIALEDANEVTLDAGGLFVGLGLRVRF